MMQFNLIPWDPEAYLVAADYAEEQGNLIPKAIRCKILPLDVENGIGHGTGNGTGWGDCLGNGQGRGNGSGYGWGDGHGNSEGKDLFGCDSGYKDNLDWEYYRSHYNEHIEFELNAMG